MAEKLSQFNIFILLQTTESRKIASGRHIHMSGFSLQQKGNHKVIANILMTVVTWIMKSTTYNLLHEI